MTILFLIFFLGLGFIIGSFLNVVVLRFNTGKKLDGRSSCYSCHTYLHWYELIPVFSWLVQKGRCRSCSSKISTQYIIGEVLTGILFLSAALRGLWNGADLFSLDYVIGTLYLCITFSILVVIFFYDLKHKIIPDSLSLMFGILGLISLFLFSFDQGIFLYDGLHLPELMSLLALAIVPLPFFLLWLFSRGRFMGLGDPKLMVGMAAFMGLEFGFSAVFISFWIGTGFLVIMGIYHELKRSSILVNKDKKSIMKMEIPFGPFLILGFVATITTYISIFSL